MVHHFTSVCHTGLCNISVRRVATTFFNCITMYKDSLINGQLLDKGYKFLLGILYSTISPNTTKNNSGVQRPL
jgi:hypothetical protein